jgi:glutamate-1-semialdehyde 2,1-aminomutase
MLLAEAIRDRVPSCERVRLMNSGTEATSTAVRLARGFTGRDRIVIFARQLPRCHRCAARCGRQRAWPRSACRARPGCRRARSPNTMVVPYNVVPELDDQVAAVFVEPVAANMGVVAPAPGFLEPGCAPSATGWARCWCSTR